MRKILLLLWIITSVFHVSDAQSYAPSSVAESTMYASVISGSGFYAEQGNFILITEQFGNRYTIYGGPGVEGTFGTYSYSRTGPNTAQIVLADSALGIQFSQSIEFTSPSTGTYRISDGYGTQRGTFELRVPRIGNPSDWLNDKHFPWVWNQEDGWMYYLPRNDGIHVYSLQTRSWSIKN